MNGYLFLSEVRTLHHECPMYYSAEGMCTFTQQSSLRKYCSLSPCNNSAHGNDTRVSQAWLTKCLCILCAIRKWSCPAGFLWSVKTIIQGPPCLLEEIGCSCLLACSVFPQFLAPGEKLQISVAKDSRQLDSTSATHV